MPPLGWLLLGLLIGSPLGWIQANHAIATECQKLGAFYVGDTTYQCMAKERSDG